MNPNKLLKDVKTELGIGSYIATKFSDYEIYQNIVDKARKDFGRIYGYDWFIRQIQFNQKNSVNGKYGAYFIDNSIMKELKFEESSITGIRHLGIAVQNKFLDAKESDYFMPIGGPAIVYGGGMSGINNHYGTFFGGMQSNYPYQDLAPQLGIMQTRVAMEMYRQKIKAKFEPPDRLIFDPRGIDPSAVNFELELKIHHPRSMWTIDEGFYHIVFQLAIYDTQTLLWNGELKGVDELPNGYDTSSLKISHWENAHRDKIEYLQKCAEEDVSILAGGNMY